MLPPKTHGSPTRLGLNWKFTPSETERIELQILTKSGIYPLLRKVRLTGLFRFAEARPHDDGEGWCIAVAEEGVPELHALWNMHHLKTLCLRNGLNLKQLLQAGQAREAEENRRGFKTVGRLPSENSLPPKKIADMI